jgi:ATP-dependent DNA ligase
LTIAPSAWIVESALKNHKTNFIIDGEAVVLGVDGVSDFDALASRQHDEDAPSSTPLTAWSWGATICEHYRWR